MNSTRDLLQALNLTIVEQDINYIIYCHTNNILETDVNVFKVRKYMFESSQILYKEMLHILHDKNYGEFIIDIMPFIDEYLEFYDTAF